MKWSKWLEDWEMTSLKINHKCLEMDWNPNTSDKDAAWDLYIELLTRISTQYLEPEHGDENSALESIHSLFGLTREILRRHKRGCVEFAKIAIPVLNQVIRPFTAKWHKLSLAGAFEDTSPCLEFRSDLLELQIMLRRYTCMLGSMAKIEDLSDLEIVKSKSN